MRESEVAQSYPTLPDPMDCSLPGSSTHGIFQARVLEWGAIAFSVCMLSHVQLFVTLWTVAHKTPLSVGFSRQEYWSGLPFISSPRDLPNPGIKLESSALAGRFFTTEPPGKLINSTMCVKYLICARCCVGLWRYKIS